MKVTEAAAGPLFCASSFDRHSQRKLHDLDQEDRSQEKCNKCHADDASASSQLLNVTWLLWRSVPVRRRLNFPDLRQGIMPVGMSASHATIAALLWHSRMLSLCFELIELAVELWIGLWISQKHGTPRSKKMGCQSA
jgi:hypothetical protein